MPPEPENTEVEIKQGTVNNKSGESREVVHVDPHNVCFRVAGQGNRTHAPREKFIEWLNS